MKTVRILNIITALFIIATIVYYGGKGLGFWGPQSLSTTEIHTLLSTHAEEINSGVVLDFDETSKLLSATTVDTQITIYGQSHKSLAELADGMGPEAYLKSRTNQVAQILCHKEEIQKALNGGATFVYDWKDAAEEHIGIVTASGKYFCRVNTQ